jgi:4-hydroxybenzoate polyprenyltransferase
MNGGGKFRPWLVLARASNLPTVWSNCIAGCWLGGWNSPATVVLLCVAGSLFYTGGMFLNDVCDVAFDREHKADRPIVAGQVTRKRAGILSALLFLSGLLLALAIKPNVLLFGAFLVVLITTYDLMHKHVSGAPLLMGACRFVLYLTAAAAGAFGVTLRAFIFASGLALYVVGLSYLARGEAVTRHTSRLWLMLLFTPLLIGLYFDSASWSMLCAVPLLLWTLRALVIAHKSIGRGVAALLAGMVLVDLLAVSPLSMSVWAGFIVLFGAALLFQRYVPAT